MIRVKRRLLDFPAIEQSGTAVKRAQREPISSKSSVNVQLGLESRGFQHFLGLCTM